MKKLILAAHGLLLATNVFAVAPLISDVPDQNIAQGASTGALYFTIGDTETTFSLLTVVAVSSDPALLPTITLGGTNAQRTLNVTPASGLTGTATITLTVTDGEALTASSSFQVTVTTANTKPTLTALQGYQIASPGQIPAAVSFTVGDAETVVDSLNVSATSSNTNLVPNANLTHGGSGASRTVQVTPVVGQKGSAVIKLRVTDALGASAQSEFIFSVFDAASANNGFKQPSGLYVLDSTAGSLISGVRMRDGNIRNKPFVDGYVLRTEWDTLEPTDGVFDFTIIDNILSKLAPYNQKLSLMVASGFLPSWLNTLPGVVTYTAGSPATTQPVPWDPVAQERYRLMLVALSNHVVDGVPLRDHPRLAALDMWIPGLKSGIRPLGGAQIRDIPLYSRPLFEGGVLTHLANVTDNFPNVPVMIGFWTYTDSTANPSAWDALRVAILTQHDGVARPRVGFWMENLAANRADADTDPWAGLPVHSPAGTFTDPLYNSQNQTYTTFQVLGSWAQPFNSSHVDNDLNGSPEDGMDYGFNDFQCRYYEHYQADIDFANYTPEFQRWHDFFAALPAPPANNPGTLALNNTAYSIAENGGSATLTVTRSGGTTGAVSVSYATSNGSATAGNDYTASSGTLSWVDGDSASKTFTVPILNDGAHESDETVTLTLSNATGSATLGTASATLTINDDDSTLTLGYNTGGSRINVGSNVVPASSLTASGGTAPYTWALVGGTLPVGITLNAAGTFSGTSTATGQYAFTLSATDSLGVSSTQSFSMIVNAQSRAGTVTPITITGPVTGLPVTFSLYLPPGYSTPGNTARYPVIYHLHGINGTHDGNQIISVPVNHEAAVNAGLIGPCIIVFPDGYLDSGWSDSFNGLKPAETDVTLQILPYLDANYRTVAQAGKRAIQGFSMGGSGSAKFAAKFPALFSVWVGYDSPLNTWASLPASSKTGIYNDDESYFNLAGNPWYWIAQNGSTLAASNAFRQVVGAQTTDNQNFRDQLLIQTGEAPSYVETSLGHVLDPLLNAQGANSWEFIAQSFVAASSTNVLSLSATAYTVNESGGSATITVHRTSGTTGTVSVNYAMSNGTATAGSDYTAANGTLSWTDDDSASKTFTVPILNDGAREADETLTITLSNATGSATLGTAAATLTITNDDPAFTLAVSTGGTSIIGTSGTALNTTLSASGGTGSYTWTLASGSLPSGATLNSTGTITGTPSAAGIFTITARATDANGNSDTQTFTLTVSAPVIFAVTPTHNADGTFTLMWPTTIDAWYQVEFSGDLINWTLLGNSVKATTTAMTWIDDGTQTGSHPSTATRRFYRVRNWGVFTIEFSGNNFTYMDAQRTVTGIFIKPTGPGPFPSLIINHGTFGMASGFGLQRANEMSPWGLACIAADLTHMYGATLDNATWGYSPENLARNRACQAALSTRSDVNINRLAMWGHSRGAFVSIGNASDFGPDLKALGFSAGGITETADPSEPNTAESSNITAPTIMFHGSTDPIVPPADSLRLQALLNTLGVINSRVLFDTTDITPSTNAHNIHQVSTINTDMLAQWHAWLIAHGVLQ